MIKPKSDSLKKKKTSSPFETDSKLMEESSNNQSFFKNFNKKIVIITVLVICLILLVEIIVFLIVNNWNDIESYFDDLEEIRAVESVTIVENYSFNIKDVGDLFAINPFPIELSTGAPLTINQDDERLVESDYGYEIRLIAGKDFEPGVYTITQSGRASINMDITVHEIIDINDGQSAYNIPFLPGDEIQVTIFDEDDKFEINLTPQDSYIEYQPNQPGIYVYGLSNFEPQINLNKEDYDSLLYCYPQPMSTYYGLNCERIRDRDISLNGGAGTYFSINYRN